MKIVQLTIVGATRTDFILKTINAQHLKNKIRFASKIKNSDDLYICGFWSNLHGIVIRRTQLLSLEKYAGTLIHGCTHAITGTHAYYHKV